MKYKNFSRQINSMLEHSKSVSLSLLLEDDDFGDAEMDAEGDASEGEGGDETPTTGDAPAGDESLDAGVPAGDEEGVSKEQVETELLGVKDGLEKIQNFYGKFGQSEKAEPMGLQSITDYINSYVSSEDLKSDDNESKNESRVKKGYNLNRKNSISYFLNEEVDAEEVEKDIEAVNNIIDKGSSLIDQFKKGKELNIPRYVEASINAYRNFDSLFSKESIIKQATINLIVLNAGAKAEENIVEFEELFHEELHKQFGIEYEEHALITKPHKTAAGALKQG